MSDKPLLVFPGVSLLSFFALRPVIAVNSQVGQTRGLSHVSNPRID